MAGKGFLVDTIRKIQQLIETFILKNKSNHKDLSNNNDNYTASWIDVDKETKKHNDRAKRNVETSISESSGGKQYGGSVFDNLLKLSEGSKSNVLKPEKATMAEILNGPVIRKILALAQAKAAKTTQYNDNSNQPVLSGLPFNPDSFEQPSHRSLSEDKLMGQSESKRIDERRNRESSIPQHMYVKPQHENKIKSTLSDNTVADNSADSERSNAKLLHNLQNEEHESPEMQVTSEEGRNYEINEIPSKPAASHHMYGSLSHEDGDNIGQQYASSRVYGNPQTSFYPNEDGEIDDDKLKQPYINPSRAHESNEVQFAEPHPFETSEEKEKYEREWLRGSETAVQPDDDYDEEISSEQETDRDILENLYTDNYQINLENPDNEEATTMHNSHVRTNSGYQRHYYDIENRDDPFQNNEDTIASNNMEHQHSINPKVIRIMPSATFQLDNIKYNNEHYDPNDSTDPVIYFATLSEAIETDHEEPSGNTLEADISADMPMWNSDIGRYRSMDQNVAAETAISSSATTSKDKHNRYTSNTFVPPSIDDESNAMKEEIEDDTNISERISATSNDANSKEIERDFDGIKYDKFGRIKMQENLLMREYNEDTFKYHSQRNDNDNDNDDGDVGMTISAQKDFKNEKNALRSSLSNINHVKIQTANENEEHFLGNSQFDYSSNSAYKDKSTKITEFSIDSNMDETILESQNKNYNLKENEKINGKLSAQGGASIHNKYQHDLLGTISSDDPHGEDSIEVRKQGTNLKKEYDTVPDETSMQTINIHDHNNDAHISRSEFPIDKFGKRYKLNNVHDFDDKDTSDNRKIKFNKFTQDKGKINYGNMQEEKQSSTSSKVTMQSKASIFNENNAQNQYNGESNQYDYYDHRQKYNRDAQYDQRKKYSHNKYPDQRVNHLYAFNQPTNDMTLSSSMALDRNKIEARNKYPDFLREQKDNKPNVAIESLIPESKATEKSRKEDNLTDEEKTLLDKAKKERMENENSYVHLEKYKKRPIHRKNFKKENIPILIRNKNNPVKLILSKDHGKEDINNENNFNINKKKNHKNQFHQQQNPPKSILLQSSDAQIGHTYNNDKEKQFAGVIKSNDFTNNVQIRSNALSRATTGKKSNNRKYQDNLLKVQLNANPIERQYDVRNEKLQQKYNDLILHKKDKAITSLLPAEETNFGETRNTLQDFSEAETSFNSRGEKRKYENTNDITKNDLNARNAASMQISSSKRIKDEFRKDSIKSLPNSYAKSQIRDDPNLSHNSQITRNIGNPESRIFNNRKDMHEKYLTNTNLLSDPDHKYTKNRNSHILKDNSRGTAEIISSAKEADYDIIKEKRQNDTIEAALLLDSHAKVHEYDMTVPRKSTDMTSSDNMKDRQVASKNIIDNAGKIPKLATNTIASAAAISSTGIEDISKQDSSEMLLGFDSSIDTDFQNVPSRYRQENRDTLALSESISPFKDKQNKLFPSYSYAKEKNKNINSMINDLEASTNSKTKVTSSIDARLTDLQASLNLLTDTTKKMKAKSIYQTPIIKNNPSKITTHPYPKTQIGNTHHSKNFLKGSNKNSAGAKIESMRDDQGNQLKDLYRTKISFNNVPSNQHGLIENNVKNEKLKEDQEVTVNLANSARAKGDREVKGSHADGWIAADTFVKDRTQNKQKFDILKEVEKTAVYKKTSAETPASGNIEDEQRHVQTDDPHNREYNSNIAKEMQDVGAISGVSSEINALESIDNKNIDKISKSLSKNAYAEIERKNKNNNNNRQNFKYFNTGKTRHSFNSIEVPSTYKGISSKTNVNPHRINKGISDVQAVTTSTLKKGRVPSISITDLHPSSKHSCDNNNEIREFIREAMRLYQVNAKYIIKTNN